MGNNTSTSNNIKETEKDEDHNEISNCTETSDAYYSLIDKNDSRFLHSVSTQNSLKTGHIDESEILNIHDNKKTPESTLSTNEYYTVDEYCMLDLTKENPSVNNVSNLSQIIEEDKSESPEIELESSLKFLISSEQTCEENAQLCYEESRSLSPIIKSQRYKSNISKELNVGNVTLTGLENKLSQEVFSLSPVLSSQSCRHNTLKNRTISNENAQLHYGKSQSLCANICNGTAVALNCDKSNLKANTTETSKFFENTKGENNIDKQYITDEDVQSQSPELVYESYLKPPTEKVPDENSQLYYEDSQSLSPIIRSQQYKPKISKELTLSGTGNNEQSQEVLSLSPVIGSQSYRNNLLKNRTISNKHSQPSCERSTSPVIGTQSYKRYKSRELHSENVIVSDTGNKNNPLAISKTLETFEADRNSDTSVWLRRTPYIYNCPFCRLNFRYYKNLKYHLFTHREPKEECSFCGKSYRLKCHLTQHIRRNH